MQHLRRTVLQCCSHRCFASTSQPASAEVVVCGGGLTGLSVAYQLSKRGANVVLVEKRGMVESNQSLSCGYISPSQLWQYPDLMRRVAQCSRDIYLEFEKQFPEINYETVGRLYVSGSVGSAGSLMRMQSIAVALGIPVQLLSPDEIRRTAPFLTMPDLQVMPESSDVSNGLLVADDAQVNAQALFDAFLVNSLNSGVTVVDRCEVKKICLGENNKIYGIETEHGFLETPKIVDCMGIHSGRVPLKAESINIRVQPPLQPCAYLYLITEAADNILKQLECPVIHDIDEQLWFHPRASPGRSHLGGFMKGVGRAVGLGRTTDRKQIDCGNAFTGEWDMFLPVLEAAVERFEGIGDVPHIDLISGIEAYTPDGQIIVGQMPHMQGYYVASGMCGQGTTLAGGVGVLMADWILEKKNNAKLLDLTADVSRMDAARFLDIHGNPYYLDQRASEIVSQSHRMIYNGHQCESARNLRMSPIHNHLKNAGAVFGEIMGYERPLYFVPEGDEVPSSQSSSKVGQDDLVGRPPWFQYVASEYEASREMVGLMDMSNFCKFDILGEDQGLVDYLQKICSGDVDKPVGTTTYTGVQDHDGGYVTDCTLSRLDKFHYFMIAPTVQQVRCRAWLEQHLPEDRFFDGLPAYGANYKTNRGGITIQDVTSMYTALNVIGPNSRALMQELANISMAAHDFPTFQCKEVTVGFASRIRAISVTHCGELGYVLYIPNEFAQNVYEQLVATGREYGLRHVGYYAMRHLRIEKFYVYWGQDISGVTTPFECGRDFRVSFEKDFIGKEALLRQKEEGVKRRYVQILVDRHNLRNDPWPQGQEPVYRNGKLAGWITTAAYGFTLACQVCLGYVEQLDMEGRPTVMDANFIHDMDAEYVVEIAGKRFPVRVNLHSPILPMISSEHPTHFRPTQ